MVDTDLIYGVDFQLTDSWFEMTYDLGLETSQQTYFLWLWMYTAQDITYNRIPDGGNAETGFSSNIGAVATANSMTIMQLEFPLLVEAMAMS